MKLKFWPFPLSRVYKTSEWLTSAFLEFASADDLVIESGDTYRIRVSCSLGSMRFWVANKFYGYANQGSLMLADGVRVEWGDAMPSRYAVREMEKALARCVSRKAAEAMEQARSSETAVGGAS